MFPSAINARRIIQEAIKAVPAVRFALGLAGIAAALAIIVSLFTDPLIALFGTVVMLLGHFKQIMIHEEARSFTKKSQNSCVFVCLRG